ncbi:hypothetical protein Tco_1554977 [Tanacetum coccineum]
MDTGITHGLSDGRINQYGVKKLFNLILSCCMSWILDFHLHFDADRWFIVLSMKNFVSIFKIRGLIPLISLKFQASFAIMQLDHPLKQGKSQAFGKEKFCPRMELRLEKSRDDWSFAFPHHAILLLRSYGNLPLIHLEFEELELGRRELDKQEVEQPEKWLDKLRVGMAQHKKEHNFAQRFDRSRSGRFDFLVIRSKAFTILLTQQLRRVFRGGCAPLT